MTIVSKQKQRIEGVIRACEEMRNSVSEMDLRFSFFRLMEKIVVMTEEVEKYIERSKSELLLDVDRDFEYDEYAKKLYGLVHNIPTKLRLQLPERNAPLLKDESLMNEEYVMSVTKRFIPDEEVAIENMEPFNDDNYRKVLLQTGVYNLIPFHNMPIFIKTALRRLSYTMFDLHRILVKGDPTLYEGLFDKQFPPLRLSLVCETCKDDFDTWRDNHEAYECDPKWKQKLREHIQDCLAKLFDSHFLDHYESSMTEDDKSSHEEHYKNLKKLGDEYLSQYLSFCDLIELSFNKKGELNYKINKKRIGRYLYKQRKKIAPGSTYKFLEFLAQLQLHKDALEEKMVAKELNYNAPLINFRNLLTESKWIGKALVDGYNTNYLENFIEALMKSEYRDSIAKKWSNKSSREKMKAYLLGALSGAGILDSNASNIARLYTGKKADDKETKSFGRYISEGKNVSKCEYSDWVKQYVKGEV